MDKYTYNLKVEKIQSLVREEEYAAAAKIADSMDWKQEHNVRLLTAVAESYEKSGQPERAIDVLQVAYDRAPIGKRIMYKLTELALQSGKIRDAESYYRRYLEEAPEENNRYILRYLIAEAKEESQENQIRILETYKKYEFEEKWACRLAELYQQTGQKEKCVALCDEIILWFGVGPYVDRAMELKETYQPLTDAQREHRENREYYQARVRAVANEMAEVMEEKDSPDREEQIEEVDASEMPLEDLSEGTDLPVISISQEVAEAKIEEASSVVLTEREEEPVVRAADTVWNTDGAPVVTVADSLQEETEEEIPEEETAQAGEDTELEEKIQEEPVQEQPAAEEEKKEEMGSTRNLKDILRRTIGMIPLDEPDDPRPTKEIILPEEIRSMEEPETEPTVEKISIPKEEDKQEEEEVQNSSDDEKKEEEPIDTPFLEENTEENPDTLASNANVLPVLSFEETERAVWEDQTRRRTEAEPMESHEMERCIFISTTSSEEGVNKAVEALDQYYEARGEEVGQIAKIMAEKLNRRGLVKSLVPLENRDLIIDSANALSDGLIRELVRVIDHLDTTKVFVLLDTPENVETLRQRIRSYLIATAGALSSTDEDMEEVRTDREETPPVRREETRREEPMREEPVQKESQREEPQREESVNRGQAERAPRRVQHLSFDRMLPSQELSERDFIRYADYYAAELECVLDDSGFDALEDEIDAILDEGGHLTAGEAAAIIEDAAEHASKPTIKRFFGGKYDKDGNLILRERDFR